MKQFKPHLLLMIAALTAALTLPAAARGGGGGRAGLGGRLGGGLGRGGGVGRGGGLPGGGGRGGGGGRTGNPRTGDGPRGDRGGRMDNNRRVGGGLGSLGRRNRNRFIFYPGWFFYSGFYGRGRNWYRSPFYDPFYDGFYHNPPRDRDREARAEEQKDNVEAKVFPENTSIYVNGLLYSSKGKAHFSLPTGKWNVELRAPGYQSQTMELEVQQGQHYTIERKLDRD